MKKILADVGRQRPADRGGQLSQTSPEGASKARRGRTTATLSFAAAVALAFALVPPLAAEPPGDLGAELARTYGSRAGYRAVRREKRASQADRLEGASV